MLVPKTTPVVSLDRIRASRSASQTASAVVRRAKATTGSTPLSVHSGGIWQGAPASAVVPVHCGGDSHRDADFPRISDCHVVSRSEPRGVHNPIPVINTRGQVALDTSTSAGIVTVFGLRPPAGTTDSEDRPGEQHHHNDPFDNVKAWRSGHIGGRGRRYRRFLLCSGR